MNFARVIGKIVATRKVDSLTGVKLLLLQPLDKHLKSTGTPIVALDPQCSAGQGELVYYVSSGDATEAFELPTPTDATVVGIIDHAVVEQEVRGER